VTTRMLMFLGTCAALSGLAAMAVAFRDEANLRAFVDHLYHEGLVLAEHDGRACDRHVDERQEDAVDPRDANAGTGG
jgi:hypothetical protein